MLIGFPNFPVGHLHTVSYGKKRKNNMSSDRMGNVSREDLSMAKVFPLPSVAMFDFRLVFFHSEAEGHFDRTYSYIFPK